MSSNPSSSESTVIRTVTVWSGEWPYVKRGVSQVRQSVVSVCSTINDILNIPAYLSTARRYSMAAEDYVSHHVHRVSTQLEHQKWAVPATGITLTSLFVVAKSAPWGSYKAFRNGFVVAGCLIVLLFPREIMASVDATLPFGTRGVIPEPSDLKQLHSEDKKIV